VVAAGASPKAAANWMMSDIASYLNTHKLDYPDIALKPETLAELIGLIEQGVISSKLLRKSCQSCWKKAAQPAP
jgi:aspartyl-tRNA(Asn)/glutamyl-tRNA(Gln) amidotransferase subunit B